MKINTNAFKSIDLRFPLEYMLFKCCGHWTLQGKKRTNKKFINIINGK